MRPRDIGCVYDMAQIGLCDIFETRRSFVPPAPIAGMISRVVAALGMVGKARRPRTWSDILQMPGGCAALQRTSCKHARLPDTATLPISVENLVETLPIRMGRAEQRAQSRLEQ